MQAFITPIGITLAAAALLPAASQAAEIILAPAPDASTYSMVVVDARKLKTTLPAALAAYPGEECLPAADSNSPLNCPGVTITGAYSYPLATGFPAWPDPNDPRKTLKIDGLKTADFSNFRIITFCPGGVCPPTPSPEAITVSFNRPATELSMMFQASSEAQGNIPWISGFRISVNGVDLGFHAVPAAGVQTLGVRAPEGLQTVSFTPIAALNGVPEMIGGFWGHRLYYK